MSPLESCIFALQIATAEDCFIAGVCLVEGESSGQTDVVGPPNTDGSRDHGLFQINDRYWCEDGPNPGKECNVRCSGRLLFHLSTWKDFGSH